MAEETPPESIPPPSPRPPRMQGGHTPGHTGPGIPQDADDTRGRHLADLVNRPWLVSGVLAACVAGFAIGTSSAGVLVGGAIALAIPLMIAGIAYLIATGKAEDDFFTAYAETRGLERTEKGSLPPLTSLLRKGDKREGKEILRGPLGQHALPGVLALYTYEEHRRDSEGNKQVSRYDYTVALHEIPGLAEHAREIYCQRRSGLRVLDSAEDVFRRKQRLELESEAFDKRFEVFFGERDDENWMKQLFSPTFIVWLSESAPDKLAFETSGNSLCVDVKGHRKSAAELDAIAEAASQIAFRLASEAAE